MGAFVRAATVDDILDGSMKHVVVQGKDIAIARIGDDYYAIDDTCTHERCSLSDEGFLDGNIATCGCHGAQFDITSGAVLALPAPSNLKSYPVRVQGLEIFIEV